MKQPKLMQMSIRPSANGGHNVRHEYHPSAKFSKGALGMTMDRPEPKEFNFGPGQAPQLMKHIGQALALKGLAGGGAPGEATAPDQESAVPAGE